MPNELKEYMVKLEGWMYVEAYDEEGAMDSIYDYGYIDRGEHVAPVFAEPYQTYVAREVRGEKEDVE
jgi:hypothetical protein